MQVYKLNIGSLEGLMNNLEKAHLVFGLHDQVSKAIRKKWAKTREEKATLEALALPRY